MLFQKLLDFDRGHASASGGGDGLAITAVLHVAAGKDSVDASHHVVVRFEIAIGVGVELAGKHLRVGFVANTEEQRAGGEVPDTSPVFMFRSFRPVTSCLVGIVNVFDHGVGAEIESWDYAARAPA